MDTGSPFIKLFAALGIIVSVAIWGMGGFTVFALFVLPAVVCIACAIRLAQLLVKPAR